MKGNDIITKLKFFIDFDKELAYISEMNKNGWKLVYIKWGCFYTFTKTEPYEYITILHFEDKEKISGLTAFAAQCGYETIPHTMDGLGETLYFTGKKSEVSEDFVNDIETKIHAQKKIFKKFFVLNCVLILLNLILIAETLLCVGSLIIYTVYGERIVSSDIPFIILSAFFVLFTIAYTVMNCFITPATVRLYSKIKKLEKEREIYE